MNSFLTPFKESFLFKIILAIVLFFYSLITSAQIAENSAIFKILKSKDSIIFERAFNKCELKKLEPIIAQNFEFYHDLAGIQNRETFINAIKNNICKAPATFTRKLVKNSLEVFELKNNGKLYGAIQRGQHDFYNTENKNTKKTGTAKFTHLWILEDHTWKLKRVLSFDHKEATE
ncbi:MULTISPECIES: nuclear transport factor 2 family protein [unclassified Polaribacter]|uniref:nuclear transport factor 2 family protein n=1 Tax=unclassified Polaribacter TaxID=196858 RepID=UPI0011BDBB08|nr:MULTISPECIES: nuclear transport factor 2 family protein [unclassified Polaribacter]TXD51061.1 nuclear transport factor 2 family protein [Polaribacter sp. IC063]TXD57942.1 nuclear transport factor 2 family protein [Polaribacter sp. IC066]